MLPELRNDEDIAVISPPISTKGIITKFCANG